VSAVTNGVISWIVINTTHNIIYTEPRLTRVYCNITLKIIGVEVHKIKDHRKKLGEQSSLTGWYKTKTHTPSRVLVNSELIKRVVRSAISVV